jgi:hypothetical protein
MKIIQALKANSFLVFVSVFSTLVIGASLLVSWSWGPVDDPGQVIAMQSLVDQHGYIGGILNRIGELASGDVEAGVFRPLAYIYPALLYTLPSGLAHLLRIVMLLVIVIAPVVYMRRRNHQRDSVLVLVFILSLAGSATLIQGVTLLSIQEVGGAFFIALGLISRNKYFRLMFWLLAAFFKGPFSWILIGYAIYQWMRKDKRLATISGLIGISVLLTNALWSLGGSYSGRYITNPLDPQLWANASKILEPMNTVLLVIVLWWAITTKSRLHRKRDFIIFAAAFFGYFFQMIPWGFTAYYMGPISYFLALMLIVTITVNPEASYRQIAIGLTAPFFLMIWVVGNNVSLVLRTNEIMRESTTCLGQITDGNVSVFGDALYVTSSPEGPIRIEQNAMIEFPNWRGSLNTETNSLESAISFGATHLLVIDELLPKNDLELNPVCTSGPITLYQLASGAN